MKLQVTGFIFVKDTHATYIVNGYETYSDTDINPIEVIAEALDSIGIDNIFLGAEEAEFEETEQVIDCYLHTLYILSCIKIEKILR